MCAGNALRADDRTDIDDAAAGGIELLHRRLRGESETQHYFSMEWLEGGSIKDLLAEGPLAPRLAAELMRQAAEAVAHAHPRTEHFKEDIIQAFYDGIKHKPETTFGNVKADVLADKDPHFTRGNFCRVIRGSAWRG